MKINFKGMLEVLPDAMIGWLGVFAVTAAIIAVIWVLNKATSGKE